MNTRKLFCVVWALLLCGTGVFAQTEADFDVTLTADGKGVVVVKYTGTGAQVRIPAAIQGVPVREIGNGEDPVTGPGVTGVVIPAGVTIIGDYAFADCTSLTILTLPANLQTIGERAFSGGSSNHR